MSTNLSDDVKVRLRDPQLLDVKDPAAGSAQSIDPGDTFGEGESVFLSKEDVRVFSAEEKEDGTLEPFGSTEEAAFQLLKTAVIPLLQNRGYYDLRQAGDSDFLVGKFIDRLVTSQGPMFLRLNDEEKTPVQIGMGEAPEDNREARLLELISGLTNLSKAQTSDFISEGVKGVIEGIVGAEAARKAGRAVLKFAPITNPVARLGAAALTGLGSAIGFGTGTNYILEEAFPRREDLLPGEQDKLGGTRLAGSFIGGTRSLFRYSPEPYGPALTLARLEQLTASPKVPGVFKPNVLKRETGYVEPTKPLRFGAAIDRLLPAARRQAERRPVRTITSEGLLAALSGVAYNKLELSQASPLTQFFVETGLGFTPTYSFVTIADNLSKALRNKGVQEVLKTAGKFALSPLATSAQLGVSGAKRAKQVFKRGESLSAIGRLLNNTAYRRATQQILEVFKVAGEDPIAVAKQIESGDFSAFNRIKPQDAAQIRSSLKDAGIELDKISTFGMTTGSPALLTLEARYGGDKYNKSLSEVEANMLNSQRLLLASLYTATEQVDSTQAEPLLKLISKIRAEEFANKIVSRFADVAKRSTDAALRIGSKFTAGITNPELRDRISLSEVLTKRLVQEVEVAQNISNRLYKESTDELTKLQPLKTFFRMEQPEGGGPPVKVEAEKPNFIELWDRITAGHSPQDERYLMGDPLYRKISDTIDRLKGQIGLGPRVGKKQSAFDNLREDLQGTGAFENYQNLINDPQRLRLVTNNPDYAQGFELNEFGEIRATEGNIERLGAIENKLKSEKGLSKLRADFLKLIKANREALIEESSLSSDALDGINPEELIKLRSDALSLRAENNITSDKVGNNQKSSIGGLLQAAILDDLDANLPENVGEKYNAARSFYKGFKDAFARTFAGVPAATKGRDEFVLNPALYAQKLLSGSEDQTYSKVKQIHDAGNTFRENAVKFLDKNDPEQAQLIKEAESAKRSVEGEVAFAIKVDLLRPLKKGLKEIEQKNLSKEKAAFEKSKFLENFRKELESNEEKQVLLKQIWGEEFNSELQKVKDADNLLKLVKDRYETSIDKIKDDFALSEALNKGSAVDPFVYVNMASGKRNPTKALNSILRDARRYDKKEGGTGAVDALKRALFESVFNAGGGAPIEGEKAMASLAFDPRESARKLFGKGTFFKLDGRTTLAEWMISSKVASESEIEGFFEILKSMEQFKAQFDLKNIDLTNAVQDMNFIQDLYLRLAGARVGTALGSALPGGRGATGLVEPAAGVRLVESITKALPAGKQLSAVSEIIKDRRLLLQALKTPLNAKDKAGTFKFILNKLAEKLKLSKEDIEEAVQLRRDAYRGTFLSREPRVVPVEVDDEEENDEVSSVDDTSVPVAAQRPPTVVAAPPPIPRQVTAVQPPRPPLAGGPIDPARAAFAFGPQDMLARPALGAKGGAVNGGGIGTFFKERG